MAAGHRAHRRLAAIIRLERRPCHLHQYGLCKYNGEPIDYDARWPDPRSYSSDHKVSTNAGGRDTYDNLDASHLRCNTARHDDPLDNLIDLHSESW